MHIIFEQWVFISPNSIDHIDPLLSCLYNNISHHLVCKSNGDNTGDVNFFPWCTAYFGFTIESISIRSFSPSVICRKSHELIVQQIRSLHNTVFTYCKVGSFENKSNYILLSDWGSPANDGTMKKSGYWCCQWWSQNTHCIMGMVLSPLDLHTRWWDISTNKGSMWSIEFGEMKTHHCSYVHLCAIEMSTIRWLE